MMTSIWRFGVLVVLASGCGEAATQAPVVAPDMPGEREMGDAVELGVVADLPVAPPDMEVAPEQDMADMGMPDLVAADMSAPDMEVPTSWRGRCAEVERFNPVFPAVVETWTQQDDLNPAWPAPVVFVGSSSVRRWEGLAREYSLYNPVQRGFGGAQLGEVAYYADALINRHRPRAVVVFAGTNDVSGGVAAEVVVERLRCLRERIGDGAGWGVPIVFIGITPTPSRWATWPQSAAVNEAVIALAAEDPALHYADVPTAFLRTGQPPADNLFVADRLHLSAAGYALWQSVLGPAVAAAISTAPAPTPAALARGERILIDLGPSNPEDGAPTRTDARGQRWNSWHPINGNGQVMPGERLAGLVTAAGEGTGVELVVTGGFGVNGLRNGGLTAPSEARLGALAVASATSDFFYSDSDDIPGGLYLSGLDPARRYTLRLFGARSSGERRVTSYVVAGTGSQAASLQTSGPNAGAAGGDVNDHRVATITQIAPDAAGRIFVDVRRVEGQYAYLSLMELEVE